MNRISAMMSSRCTGTVPSISFCMITPGIYAEDMSGLYISSMKHNITRYSSNIIGDLFSSLVVYLWCFCLSQHSRTLIAPSLLSFRKICYGSSAILSSQGRVFGSHGSRKFLWCICNIQFNTSCDPYFKSTLVYG